MNDLISRQAAIEVADAVWAVTGDKNVAKVWDEIKDLPSAQPEITEKQVKEYCEKRCLVLLSSDAFHRLNSAQPEKRTNKRTETHVCDLINRKAAIDALERKKDKNSKGDIGGFYNKIIQNDIDTLMQLPSAQPEPLTDKEQRIFLAAMEKEEKICKHVDEEFREFRDCREPYEDSLVRTCHEITRKVKGALWT